MICGGSSEGSPRKTMDNTNQVLTTLATLGASLPPRPPDSPVSMPLLERARGFFRLRDNRALRLLTRDARGIIHRLQGRRIVHFLHIGKTAGTALTVALVPHLNAGDYEIRLYGHECGLDDFPRGEKVVFIVRDPISRFVSGFHSRKRQGLPRLPPVPWSRGEEVAFARFATPNELALALSSEAEGRRAAALDAMRSISHIRSPHWCWFKDESYFLSRQSDILFIGFQETLNEDFEVLKRLLTLPEAVKLPDNEVTANRARANVDKRLDDEAIRNLKAWYHRDYEFVDLCRGIAARIRCDLEGRRAEPARLEPIEATAGAG